MDALALAALLSPLFVVAGALWLAPVLAPGLFFAVTTEPAFRGSPEGAAALGAYRRVVGVCSLVILAGALLAGRQAYGGPLIAPAAALMALLLCGGFAFFAVQRRVLPHRVAASQVREASLSPRRLQVAGGLYGQLAPFLICAAAALYLRLRWDSLPERFPMHWGPGGAPDAWGTRTPADVFAGPLHAGAMCLGLSLLGLAIGWPTLAASAPRTDAQRRLVGRLLLCVEISLAAFLNVLAAYTLLRAPAPDGRMPAGALALGLAGPLLLSPLLLIYAALAMQRIAALPGPAAGDGTPDAAWRFGGLVYVNPSDPALWVPKRSGLGLTVNLGRRSGQLLLFGLLALLLGAVGLALAHG